MLGPVPFLVLGVLLAAVLVLVAIRFWSAVRPVPAGAEPPGLTRLRRVAVLARVLGLFAGLATPFLLAGVGRLGLGLALAPTVVAAVLVTAGLVAELLSWRDARGGSAALEVRRVRDYLPRATTGATVAGLVVLVAVGVWTTVVAAPDDLGRPGRSYGYTCRYGSGCDSGSFGPFPGSFYTVPLLVGLVALLVLAGLAVVVAVRRPRDGADSAVRRVDEQVRRSAVSTAVAAVLLAVSGSLTGIGLTAGRGLLVHADVLSGGLRVAGVLITGAGLAGLGLLVWAVAALVVPLVTPAPAAASPVPSAAPER